MTSTDNTQQHAREDILFASLNAAQRAVFLGFMTPLFILALVLKSLRVGDHQYVERAWYVWPDLMASDVFFFGALSACCLAVLGFKRTSKVLILPVQLIYLGWFFFEFVAHRFYFTTGSILDWSLVQIYIKYIRQLWGMANILNTPTQKTVATLILAIMMSIPWLILWRQKPSNATKISQKKLLIIAAISTLLAGLFPLFSSETRLGRNAIVELAYSGAFQNNAMDTHSAKVRQPRTLKRTDAQKKPRSIILIILESTSTYATSTYNPKLKDLTPTLDHIAQNGTLFEHNMAIVPHTSKALFNVICGTYAAPIAPMVEAGREGTYLPCLPEMLHEQGYDTAFFQGATMLFENRHTLLNNMGYNYMFGGDDIENANTKDEPINYFGYGSKSLIEPSRTWLEQKDKDKPFLLTFLTLAPHHDYVVPKGFPTKQYHEDEDFNRYLNCIAYQDSFIKELLDMLEEQGVLKDSIVALVGDHGEAFGQHGQRYHDNIMYQEAVHTPMILMGPGVEKNRRIKEAATQLDLVPMLSDLAGFEVQGEADGVNMLDPTAQTTPRTLYTYCWYERSCAAAIQWPFKYIHRFGMRPDELFHLEHDPKERLNLLDDNPQNLSLPDTNAMRDDLLEHMANIKGKHLRQ